MKSLLYTLGWPWLFGFTRKYLNLDLEKDILPDGSVKYTWAKWMPNDQAQI